MKSQHDEVYDESRSSGISGYNDLIKSNISIVWSEGDLGLLTSDASRLDDKICFNAATAWHC
jgi:hypothetical protein